MLVFKSVFRLDYPFSFAIFDRLGQYLEVVDSATKAEPFSNPNNQLDPINHSFVAQAMVGGAHFRLSVSLKSVDAVIEIPKGSPLKEIPTHEVVKLADLVVSQMSRQGHKRYLRIGWRNWIIAENPRFEFDPILSVIVKQNSKTSEAVREKFARVSDVAVTYEAENEARNLRIQFGPYQESEYEKHFTAGKPPIKSGLILDIDVWERNLDIPDFKLASHLREYQKDVFDVVSAVVEKIRVELSDATNNRS